MACHWLLLAVGIAEEVQSAYAKVFVLRLFLLMVGYKCEEVQISEGLPTVGVTTESCALPLQAGIVVGWHPSSHRKA